MTSPFVPNFRQFPTQDAHNLERQLVNFHIQHSNAINNRTISTFPLHQVGFNDAVPNGERWFPATGKTVQQDGQRLIVQISDSSLTITHNIPLINMVTRLYGTFFDGTNWWPLPYVDVTAVNNQIGVRVTSTQLIVTKGAGAPPAVVSGVAVIEWV